jgi:hypothetical protein
MPEGVRQDLLPRSADAHERQRRSRRLEIRVQRREVLGGVPLACRKRVQVHDLVNRRDAQGKGVGGPRRAPEDREPQRHGILPEEPVDEIDTRNPLRCPHAREHPSTDDERPAVRDVQLGPLDDVSEASVVSREAKVMDVRRHDDTRSVLSHGFEDPVECLVEREGRELEAAELGCAVHDDDSSSSAANISPITSRA